MNGYWKILDFRGSISDSQIKIMTNSNMDEIKYKSAIKQIELKIINLNSRSFFNGKNLAKTTNILLVSN